MMNLTETRELETYVKENSRVIATRKLYYSEKGGSIKHELIARLYAPIELNKRVIGPRYTFFEYACYVEFSDIYRGFLFYGYDAFQAIELSVTIDLILMRKKDEYDFYFTKVDSDPTYFNETYDNFLESKAEIEECHYVSRSNNNPQNNS